MKKRLIRLFVVCAACVSLSACAALNSVLDQAASLANLANCEYNLKNVSNLTIAGVNVKNITNGNITAGDVLKLTSALVGKAVPMAMDVNIDIKNPNHVEKGVASMTVDGQKVDGNVIPFTEGKAEYNVEVVMG